MGSNPYTKIIATTTALVLLFTFAAPAMAQEEPAYYTRQIAEQLSDKKAWIASASHTPEGSDWVIFGLDTEGDEKKGLGVGAIYGGGEVPNEHNWAIASFVAPFGIVEYIDNGDGKYDLTSDDVVSLMPLHTDLEDREEVYKNTGESEETMTWYERPGYKPLEHSSVMWPGNVEEWVVTAETTNGVFAITMHVTNSILYNHTVVISPYEIKLDFIINDYPYVEDDSVLALLAIIAVGNAKWYDGLPEDPEYEYQTFLEGEDGWQYDFDGGAGFFSWLNVADVDGVETDVTTSTLFQFSEFKWTPEGATSVGAKYVAFSYARGESIIHDPKLGVVFENGIPAFLEKLVNGNGGLFVISLLFFAAVVGGARWTRMHSTKPKRRPGAPQSAPPAQPYQHAAYPRPPQSPEEKAVDPRAPPAQPPPRPPQGAVPPQGGAGGVPPQGWYQHPPPQHPGTRQNYRPR
jgi:hypothetical protein